MKKLIIALLVVLGISLVSGDQQKKPCYHCGADATHWGRGEVRCSCNIYEHGHYTYDTKCKHHCDEGWVTCPYCNGKGYTIEYNSNNYNSGSGSSSLPPKPGMYIQKGFY